MMGQAYPDRHSTSWTDAWVSCETSDSPNQKRDPGHWIMYDLGSQYSLHESTIWNFNVPDSTERGMKDIIIDYSNDAQEWTELTEYEALEAPGSAFYQGDEGPDFDGVVARYVLVSVLTSYGDACVGMSEMKINATIATSTNIPSTELDIELTANPNPASEYTNITLGEYEEGMKYSLADMSGKLMKQGSITSQEMKINTSTLPAGSYALTVYNEMGMKAILINIIQNR